MRISKELIKGSTNLLILSLLKENSMYGYEMIKKIEEKSKGIFAFKEGTLYPILHSLEGDGFVEAYWEKSEEGRKRKYYKITKKGNAHFLDKKKEWETFRDSIDSFLWEGIM